MSKEGVINSQIKNNHKTANKSLESGDNESPRGLKKDDNFLEGENMMSEK